MHCIRKEWAVLVHGNKESVCGASAGHSGARETGHNITCLYSFRKGRWSSLTQSSCNVKLAAFVLTNHRKSKTTRC